MINLAETRSKIFAAIARSQDKEVVSGIDSLIAEIERLQSQLDAYRDYISGKITLGQLEAALNRIEPVYQQKPVKEWQERREE